MKNSNFYLSRSTNSEKINLPKEVITYFQQRGHFVRDFPSYEQVRGRDGELPIEINNSIMFGEFPDSTYPIKNRLPRDQRKAEEYSLNIVSLFTRNNPRSISKLERDYMLFGCSKPIRIRSLLDKKIKSSIYVKKPSIERLFGINLYNFLSGKEKQDYIFNNYSFVEREISGGHIDQENKSNISKRERFKESAIRLATLDDFMSISDLDKQDGPNDSLSNILIKSDGSIIAFDFNTILQPYIKYEQSPLLDRLREMKIDIPINLEREIASDEARRICYTIHQNKNCFNKIVRLIDKVPYMRSRLEEGGYESAEEYFEESTSRLKERI